MVYLSKNKNYFMISVPKSNEISQVPNIINLAKQKNNQSRKICESDCGSSRTTRITLDGLLRGKITIMLKIKKFLKPF